MKKGLLLTISLFIINIYCYSQVEYEKGYFIDNNGARTDCFIKNYDWKYNPTNFKYKLTTNSSENKLSIKDVKEFGVVEYLKYVRCIVEVDRSSQNISSLSRSRIANLVTDTLFLKLQVQGKASLFSYSKSNIKLYFYSVDDSRIKQLIYKRYMRDDSKIRENIRFKQQIWDEIRYEGLDKKDLRRINYSRKDLVDYFIKYNSSGASEFKHYTHVRKSGKYLNLGLKIGGLSSSFDFNGTLKSNQVYRAAVEVEYMMPFNRNKWSLIVEPSFQYFNGTYNQKNWKTYDEVLYGIDDLTFFSKKILDDESVDAKSLLIPVGIRHNLFLKNNSRIFINASVVFEVLFGEPEIKSGLHRDFRSYEFGLGYKYNNTYSVEIKYGDSFVPVSYAGMQSDMQSFGIFLGYTLPLKKMFNS